MLLVFFFDDASKVMQSFVFGSGVSNLYLDDINSSLPRTKGAFPDPAPRAIFTHKEDSCQDRLRSLDESFDPAQPTRSLSVVQRLVR